MIADVKNLILLPAAVLWLATNRQKPRWLALLGFYLLLSMSVELTAWILGKVERNNALVYNVFSIFDFVGINWMLYHINPIRRQSRLFILASSVIAGLVLVSCLTNLNIVESHFMSFIFVTGLMLVAHSLLVLMRLASSSEESLMRTGEFWFCSSVLLYYTCSVPSLGLAMHFAQTRTDFAISLLNLNDIAFVGKFVLIIIAIWMWKKTINHVEGR